MATITSIVETSMQPTSSTIHETTTDWFYAYGYPPTHHPRGSPTFSPCGKPVRLTIEKLRRYRRNWDLTMLEYVNLVRAWGIGKSVVEIGGVCWGIEASWWMTYLQDSTLSFSSLFHFEAINLTVFKHELNKSSTSNSQPAQLFYPCKG